jgi:ABC-type nitrate/sulfonate/bicarbonate transport system ATPase subunit
MLTIDGVGASREGVPVLDEVTIETDARIVGILGRSGAGKTTLLRIVAGLDAPDRGAVLLDGEPLEAARVGLVFQDYPLFSHRTVSDNLRVAARFGGAARTAEKRCEELLATMGLEDRAACSPAQLSGGERQRAAIAQQLVLPRSVLCLDEPFSGLDPFACAKVVALLRDTTGESRLVVVTHDVRAAAALCDAIFVLERGPRGARAAPACLGAAEPTRDLARLLEARLS